MSNEDPKEPINLNTYRQAKRFIKDNDIIFRKLAEIELLISASNNPFYSPLLALIRSVLITMTATFSFCLKITKK